MARKEQREKFNAISSHQHSNFPNSSLARGPAVGARSQTNGCWAAHLRLSISSLSSGGQAGGRTWRASGHPRALVWLRCARARAAARGALRQTARREPLERSSSSLVSSLAQSLTSSSQRLADFNGQSKQTPMLVALYALAHLAAACKSQPLVFESARLRPPRRRTLARASAVYCACRRASTAAATAATAKTQLAREC